MPFSTLPFELSAVAIALMRAVAYGSGDFMGGRATVRLSPSGAVAQTTAMAVASALVALFPAVVVVLLAVLILRERILGVQFLGLAASVGDVAMLPI